MLNLVQHLCFIDSGLLDSYSKQTFLKFGSIPFP